MFVTSILHHLLLTNLPWSPSFHQQANSFGCFFKRIDGCFLILILTVLIFCIFFEDGNFATEKYLDNSFVGYFVLAKGLALYRPLMDLVLKETAKPNFGVADVRWV